MANRVSILEVVDSVIDCNWYYDCLFSPCKNTTCDPAIFMNSHGDCNDEHDIKHCSVAENATPHELKKAISLNFEDQKKNGKEVDIAERDECVARIFRILDEDGDGRVSTEEIMRFLERLSLGMPMEDVESAVKSGSACGQEFLTSMEFEDFYRALVFAGMDENEEVVRCGDGEIDYKSICEAFGVFDQNGDGFISTVELSDILCRLGLMEGRDVSYRQRMIESVDFNGDGFVDIHEFNHLITTHFHFGHQNTL